MGRGEINSEGRKLVGGYEGGDIVGERGGLHLRGKRCNWGETWETAAPASEISVVHQKVLHCSAPRLLATIYLLLPVVTIWASSALLDLR